MSYHVLARKWRPKTFSQLVGQSHVVKAFSYALDHDKVHHAYLLTGTRGVGKTSIARIFAKSLNCLEKGVSSQPCGQCSNCVDIEKGKFVDLIEVDAASRTGVDETRELIESVVYMPTKGRYKVYLIDEVHMFSKSSFNALLKTLEEPPAHVKFILATTDVEKLPVTILSRCLQFNLKRLTDAQISAHLAHICESEGIAYDKSAIETLARAGDGSLRDALSVTDQAIAYGQGELRVDDVVSILGTVHPSDVIGIVKAVLTNDPSALYAQIRRLDDYDLDVKSLFVAINQKFQLLAWAKEGVKVDVPELLLNLAKPVSKPLLQLWYDLINKGLDELNTSQDKDNTLEMTLLRLLAFIPNEMIPRHHSVTEVLVEGEEDGEGDNNNIGDDRVANNQSANSAQATKTAAPTTETIDNKADKPANDKPKASKQVSIDSETEREFYEEMLSLAGAVDEDEDEAANEQATEQVTVPTAPEQLETEQPQIEQSRTEQPQAEQSSVTEGEPSESTQATITESSKADIEINQPQTKVTADGDADISDIPPWEDEADSTATPNITQVDMRMDTEDSVVEVEDNEKDNELVETSVELSSVTESNKESDLLATDAMDAQDKTPEIAVETTSQVVVSEQLEQAEPTIDISSDEPEITVVAAEQTEQVEPAPPQQQTLTEAAIDSTELSWQQLLAQLELSDFTREFAASGLLEIDGNQANFAISPRHAVLNTEESQAELSEALTKAFGKLMHLHVDYAEVTNTPSEQILAAEEKKQSDIISGFYQQPLVAELIENFSAKVIDKTIKIIDN